MNPTDETRRRSPRQRAASMTRTLAQRQEARVMLQAAGWVRRDDAFGETWYHDPDPTDWSLRTAVQIHLLNIELAPLVAAGWQPLGMRSRTGLWWHGVFELRDPLPAKGESRFASLSKALRRHAGRTATT